MGTDILLQIRDHLFPMADILGDEENRHGEGEQADQPCDDLKAEGLIESYLVHPILAGMSFFQTPVFVTLIQSQEKINKVKKYLPHWNEMV
jgi:hypothetical protein